MPTIKEQIGEQLYTRLDEEANKEVALAMQMELVDQYRQERYYTMRQLLTLLLPEFEFFQAKGLKISPLDIVSILFKIKLLYACNSEHEYEQRTGGGSWMSEAPFIFRWEERTDLIDTVIDRHFQQLEQSVGERILATEIRDFYTNNDNITAATFLNTLFSKIELPFGVQFDTKILTSSTEDSSPESMLETGKLTFAITGTTYHSYFFAIAYLRTFLNMLRIGGFIYRGQIDFGMWGVEMMAPTGPFFLTPGAMGGGLSWDEDTKKPWEKIPDGCLFISYGYRGITALFLDEYRFGGIEKFFTDNPIIFEKLTNPWSGSCVYDIAVSLDILSSATQIPDLGAKILQIYCCLEHLFVPKDVKNDNIKYIKGAIHALRPDLLSWFNDLYAVRCDYAHKGYVQKNDETLNLVFVSLTNTIALLSAKLRQNEYTN